MFAEDLSVFFNTADFAIASTLQGGAAGGVPVIFDRPDFDALGVASTNPVGLVRATDVAESDVGKTLTINGVAFTIRDYQPQDDGAIVRLQLSAP
jgi:hypothetical protein